MALKRIIQRRFNHPFRGGRIGSGWVAALLRNAWAGWIGISGRNASEYARDIVRIASRSRKGQQIWS